jgi:ABC-type phosphate transport system substrate-binding protein
MANAQRRLAVALVAIWIAGSTGVPVCLAQSGDIAVVVNQNNPVDHLSVQEVRKIFAGEKRSWAGGSPIKLFVRAPGTRERVTLLKLLDMSEDQYKRYWTAAVFRGEAQSEPIALFSNGMQKEAIGVYPGGIALVNAQDVKSGMKMVKVEGHLPGEAGYPFN